MCDEPDDGDGDVRECERCGRDTEQWMLVGTADVCPTDRGDEVREYDAVVCPACYDRL